VHQTDTQLGLQVWGGWNFNEMWGKWYRGDSG